MHATPVLPPCACTTGEQIAWAVAQARATFETGITRDYAWRVRQLEGILRMLQTCEREILEALKEDVSKPEFEAFAGEVAYVRAEIAHHLARLARWMRPERVSTPLIGQPGQSTIVREPLGVVLIVSPWNYPFHLAVVPLIGALSAGNCALIKPSEVAPATSAFLARRLPEFLDPDAVKVVEGGVLETETLLQHRFDHIFYTGSSRVGRIIMRAAAEHLTPVTLELGGKSPAIVDSTADLEIAARRIAFGKFYNAGQTCVAPDYVLIHEDVHDEFLEWLTAQLLEFYGKRPETSPDYGRIVNVLSLIHI